MKTSTIAWIVAVIVVALGVLWYVYTPAAPAPSGNEVGATMPLPGTQTPDTEVNPEEPTASMIGTVIYDGNTFSPAEVTIKKGGTVTWTNTGGSSMWVASAQHPTHTTYAGTSLAEHCDDAIDISFDQCENGNAYSFTFDKVGTWGYHNHSKSSAFGRVIVVE